MPLGHYIITKTQSQSGTLTCWLGRKKGLEDLFFYLIGLGMVTGAQLNAALANATKNGLKGHLMTGKQQG